jgi:glycosyltransferase involved in cell wall biosynthesis
MRILHTESSSGWGGQEIRILREAEGMRERGHTIVLAVEKGGGLIAPARKAGFEVHEIVFRKSRALIAIPQLVKIVRSNKIDLINTHSSTDSWLGGIAARLTGRKLIRTRHLSTPIRPGINSRLLYNWLADHVVTTSSSSIPAIVEQAGLPPEKCHCIATGVVPEMLQVDRAEVEKFRASLGVKPDEILVGTACFVRSWKGIRDLIKAADLLREHRQIKWVVVGGGYVSEYTPYAKELDVENIVTFTGHLENPYPAIAAMDIFALLSTASEGISQASLQAAYLKRPLLTTDVGGLPEVCLHGKTGLVVPPRSPERVAQAILLLGNSPTLRNEMGVAAHTHVLENYTLRHTLDGMEKVYACLVDEK